MKLLKLIESGAYQMYQEEVRYNSMIAGYLKGAMRYEFPNDVVLRSYTNTSWFLYIDGKSASLDEVGLSDEAINAAFVLARANKIKTLVG